jgi:cytochrome c peroxidase
MKRFSVRCPTSAIPTVFRRPADQPPPAFDDFINGAGTSSADAKRGMIAFTLRGCDGFHPGPTFTEKGFHNLGLPDTSGMPKDPGRAGGFAFANKWPFTSTGRFADPTQGDLAPRAVKVVDEAKGYRRTPSLRNLESTWPYGHNGAFNTLEQAIDAHVRVLPKHEAVDAQDKRDIVELLRTLSGRQPQPPLNYRPGGYQPLASTGSRRSGALPLRFRDNSVSAGCVAPYYWGLK